ncbi:unnamed protein product [Cuscuta europaea]|uniref:Inhibitor I9 domain-containing protein n=1 Tax=Cuscuta europaea TaxID=41803 RepID=A0A9P1EJV5_CUSEU|nr:unnamed protein product [Cuscuta europaea]
MSGLQSDAHKPEDTAIYIVYTHRPQEGDESHEAFHIKILKEAFNGDDSAKEKILYHYKKAACGFSAKLTPAQADSLSKHPHVVEVVQSRTVQLHPNPTHQMLT